MLTIFTPDGRRVVTDDGIRMIRNLIIWTVLRIVGLTIVLLALPGVLIPWLVDAHRDLYLVLAILLAIATAVLTILVVVQLVLDFRRLPERFRKANQEGFK
jgi:hypothetical protein